MLFSHFSTTTFFPQHTILRKEERKNNSRKRARALIPQNNKPWLLLQLCSRIIYYISGKKRILLYISCRKGLNCIIFCLRACLHLTVNFVNEIRLHYHKSSIHQWTRKFLFTIWVLTTYIHLHVAYTIPLHISVLYRFVYAYNILITTILYDIKHIWLNKLWFNVLG